MLGRHAAKDLQSLGYLILIACCRVLSLFFLFFPLNKSRGDMNTTCIQYRKLQCTACFPQRCHCHHRPSLSPWHVVLVPTSSPLPCHRASVVVIVVGGVR
ncbi:hypothetical protein EDB86DRAFT_2888774, partial [Lactarius hatsudake]